MTSDLTPSMREFLRRFSVPIILFIGVLVLGSLGYYLLWRPFEATWLDAIYMTMITVTTVGYNEIYPTRGLGAGIHGCRSVYRDCQLVLPVHRRDGVFGGAAATRPLREARDAKANRRFK